MSTSVSLRQVHIRCHCFTITLKLEFTKFSIPFSIKESREEGSGSLKNLAFFGLFNYRLQADQEHQWNGGMRSGPSPWTATSRIHTHALYMQWFHCTFPWCHYCSQLSTTELCCKKRARNILSAEAQWYQFTMLLKDREQKTKYDRTVLEWVEISAPLQSKLAPTVGYSPEGSAWGAKKHNCN